MFVRMMTTAAGPRLPHCLNAGSVYEVDDDLGAELLKQKAAVEVPNPNAKQKAAGPVETAAIDAGEKATAEGSEKKAEKAGEAKSLMGQLTGGEKPAEAKSAKK